MAAPYTHIYLAQKVFDKEFSVLNKFEFMVGTCFPDIRRLAGIPREKTHFQIESIDQIEKSDAFTAGMLLHSYADISRSRYVEDNMLKRFFEEADFTVETLKIFEDRLLFEEFGPITGVTDWLEKVYEKEKYFGIDEAVIEKWHKSLVDYLTGDFEKDETVANFLQVSGATPEVAKRVTEGMKHIRDRKKAGELVLKFYKNFG